MHYQTSRILARNTHIAVAIVQCAYIYTPIHAMPHAIEGVQWVTFPLLMISGFWLRKGHVVWNALAHRHSMANARF